MTESKGSILGGYPIATAKGRPIRGGFVSEQSVTSVATDQVFQSTGGNPLEDTLLRRITLSKPDTPVAAILSVGELTADEKNPLLDSEQRVSYKQMPQ